MSKLASGDVAIRELRSLARVATACASEILEHRPIGYAMSAHESEKLNERFRLLGIKLSKKAAKARKVVRDWKEASLGE